MLHSDRDREDRRLLQEVSPDLRRKVYAILADVGSKPCSGGWRLHVYEVYRPYARQQALRDLGKSLTLKSKHCMIPARAVDLVWWHESLGWSWADHGWHWVGSAARAHGLVWGGDWHRLVDMCHVELPD